MTAAGRDLDAVSASLLKGAQADAAAAIQRITTLTDTAARKVALAALKAGGDKLRTQHNLRIAGASPLHVAGLATAAVASLVLDAVVVTATFRRAVRPMRILAGVSLATRAGLIVYAQYRQASIRRKISEGLGEP